MTKKLFLKRLRFALLGGYKHSERQDIINDYESFFAQEHSNGLCEADIITELGDPTTIAVNLAHEAGKPAPLGALVQKYSEHICLFFSIIVFFGAGLIYHNMRSYIFGDMTLITSGIICLVIMAIALYLALKAKMTVPNFHNRHRELIFSNILLFFLALSCCIFFNSKASIIFAYFVLENYHSRWLTNGLSEIRMFILLIAIGIGLWAIYGVWHGKSERFVTAVHAVGLCVYLETIYKLWAALIDIDFYWSKISKTGIVYGTAVIITFLSIFALNNFKKEAFKNG